MKSQVTLSITTIVLSLCFLCLVAVGRCSRRDYYTPAIPRILVLVISPSRGNDASDVESERWKQEYTYWLERIESYRRTCKNIDWKMITCNSDHEDDNHLSLDCHESYIPGILQKTVLALERNLEKYDYFVRTNLSTCIDCKKLVDMISDISGPSPMYTGGRRLTHEQVPFISGTSIVLDLDAARLLVDRYRSDQKLYDTLAKMDDVVIGKILEGKSTYSEKYGLFDADSSKTATQNIEHFATLDTPFLRTKTMLYRSADEYGNHDTNIDLIRLFNKTIAESP